MKHFLIFIVYIFASAYGLYRIKLSTSFTDLHFFVGFGFYFAGFLIWFYILKITPLSVAFPIAAGGLILATTLIGVLFLNEGFGIYKLSGAALIIAGITFMAISMRLNS